MKLWRLISNRAFLLLYVGRFVNIIRYLRSCKKKWSFFMIVKLVIKIKITSLCLVGLLSKTVCIV